MSKKVKGFNVDEDTYNSLLEIFKKYNVKVSLSAYVNDRLRGLLNGLQDVEKGLKSYERFTVPMSFIINSMLAIDKDMEYEDMEGITKEDFREDIVLTELEEWQYDYDSQTRKIPVPFLKFLRSPNFELSSDKKYLIEKETGKRYVAGKTRDTIIPVNSAE